MKIVKEVVVGMIEFVGGIEIILGLKKRIDEVIVGILKIGEKMVENMELEEGMKMMIEKKKIEIDGGILIILMNGEG